ncbi:kelch-like protein 26 isoform X2 [Oratosquilla oratoria]
MFTDAMRERGQSEIRLKGVSAVGLQGLLEYAYTSRLALNLANIQDVLAAAAHAQVLTVVEACSNYLQTQLDLDNCVDVATLAETYCLHGLRRGAYAFMSGHLQQFSRTSDFQRLSCAQLTQLLASDYPVDCSEAEVLLAVVAWLQHNPAQRGVHALALLRHVNLSEVPYHVVHRLARLPHVGTLISECVASQWGLNPQQLPALEAAGGCSPPPGLVNSRGLELGVVKVGGFSISGVTNEITYLLGSTGRWRHLTTIPHVEQCNYGTAVLNNELYVVGGCFNQALQENIHPFGFRYNPQHNKWSTMAPMARERCRFSLTVVGGRLYAVGGASESTDEGGGQGGGGIGPPLEDESPCEAYDPETDTWTPIPALPRARTQHASAALGRFLYVTGGLEGDHVLDSCHALDTATGVWTACAHMPTPRADHCLVTYGGRVYACGGWYEDEASNSRVLVDIIDVYDPEIDDWTAVTSVPTPRYHAGIVVMGARLYVVGGFHSDATFDRATGVIECFDVETETWTSEVSYPHDIWEHVCVPLYVPRMREDMDVLPIAK